MHCSVNFVVWGLCYVTVYLKWVLYFVVGMVVMETLSTQASSRVADALRFKTRRACTMMCRVFIAFCVIVKVSLSSVSVKVLLSFFTV